MTPVGQTPEGQVTCLTAADKNRDEDWDKDRDEEEERWMRTMQLLVKQAQFAVE